MFSVFSTISHLTYTLKFELKLTNLNYIKNIKALIKILNIISCIILEVEQDITSWTNNNNQLKLIITSYNKVTVDMHKYMVIKRGSSSLT